MGSKIYVRNEAINSSDIEKFDSVSNNEFRIWLPCFLAKATMKGCSDFFELDAEKEMTEIRPCELGQEERFVDNRIKVKLIRARKAFHRNVKLVMRNPLLDENNKAVEVLNLTLKHNKEKCKIKNSKWKLMKGMETSIVVFEKKERQFKFNRATAINLLFDNLGTNCLSSIMELLRDQKPWTALKKLSDRFNFIADFEEIINM